jgi:hypothetical protein
MKEYIRKFKAVQFDGTPENYKSIFRFIEDSTKGCWVNDNQLVIKYNSGKTRTAQVGDYIVLEDYKDATPRLYPPETFEMIFHPAEKPNTGTGKKVNYDNLYDHFKFYYPQIFDPRNWKKEIVGKTDTSSLEESERLQYTTEELAQHVETSKNLWKKITQIDLANILNDRNWALSTAFKCGDIVELKTLYEKIPKGTKGVITFINEAWAYASVHISHPEEKQISVPLQILKPCSMETPNNPNTQSTPSFKSNDKVKLIYQYAGYPPGTEAVVKYFGSAYTTIALVENNIDLAIPNNYLKLSEPADTAVSKNITLGHSQPVSDTPDTTTTSPASSTPTTYRRLGSNIYLAWQWRGNVESLLSAPDWIKKLLEDKELEYDFVKQGLLYRKTGVHVYDYIVKNLEDDSIRLFQELAFPSLFIPQP